MSRVPSLELFISDSSVFVRRPGDYGEIWGRGDERERDVMGGLLGTTQGFLRMRQILGCLENFNFSNFGFGK